MEELPYAIALDGRFWDGSVCFWCLKFTDTLICSRCKCARYCCKDCQRKDWFSQQHRRECPILLCLNSAEKDILQRNSQLRLTARVIARNKRDSGVPPNKYVSGALTKYDFDLRCLSDLESHEHEIEWEQEWFIFTHIYAKRSPKVYAKIKQEEFRTFFGLCLINGFSPNYSRIDGLDESLGSALYLQASRFDHSCQPNLLRYFDGNKLVIVPLDDAPLLHWSQYCISYNCWGGQVSMTDERRLSLNTHYFFHCQCALCSDETENLIREGAYKFECKSCSTPYIVAKDSSKVVCIKCGFDSGIILSEERIFDLKKLLYFLSIMAPPFWTDFDRALKIMRQAEDVLHSVRNVRLLQAREFLLYKQEELEFENRELSVELIERILETYEFYDVNTPSYPVLCFIMAKLLIADGKMWQAQNYLHKCKNIWVKIRNASHSCVKEVETVIVKHDQLFKLPCESIV